MSAEACARAFTDPIVHPPGVFPTRIAFDGEAIWSAYQLVAEPGSPAYLMRRSCDGEMLVPSIALDVIQGQSANSPRVFVSADRLLATWSAWDGGTGYAAMFQVFERSGEPVTETQTIREHVGGAHSIDAGLAVPGGFLIASNQPPGGPGHVVHLDLAGQVTEVLAIPDVGNKRMTLVDRGDNVVLIWANASEAYYAALGDEPSPIVPFALSTGRFAATGGTVWARASAVSDDGEAGLGVSPIEGGQPTYIGPPGTNNVEFALGPSGGGLITFSGSLAEPMTLSTVDEAMRVLEQRAVPPDFVLRDIEWLDNERYLLQGDSGQESRVELIDFTD